MQPFPPQKKKAEVAERGIMKAIRRRILHWNQHATIVAGRFGSGKSVALEEALRGMQGVYVHIVKDKDWEEALYKSLRMDDLGMLKEALRLVRERNQGSTPILVLDIPRTTKEGATSATLVVWCLIRLGGRHGRSLHLRQDSVVGQFAGPRRDPKTQPPCFAVLR